MSYKVFCEDETCKFYNENSFHCETCKHNQLYEEKEKAMKNEYAVICTNAICRNMHVSFFTVIKNLKTTDDYKILVKIYDSEEEAKQECYKKNMELMKMFSEITGLKIDVTEPPKFRHKETGEIYTYADVEPNGIKLIGSMSYAVALKPVEFNGDDADVYVIDSSEFLKVFEEV